MVSWRWERGKVSSRIAEIKTKKKLLFGKREDNLFFSFFIVRPGGTNDNFKNYYIGSQIYLKVHFVNVK